MNSFINRSKIEVGEASTCIVNRGYIQLNGKIIPPPPGRRGLRTTTTIINNHIYVNGYEYVNGKWKHTLKAFLYYLF